LGFCHHDSASAILGIGTVVAFTDPRIHEHTAMAIPRDRTRSIFQRYNIVSEADLRNAARESRQASVAVRYTTAERPAQEHVVGACPTPRVN